METMVKFGTPEPIIYKDPETGVAVPVRALGTVEVYTTAATEGQERDVIDVNVKQAAVLGMVKFFDNMSKDAVPYFSAEKRISDAQKAIAATIKNAGYGVGMVMLHKIQCSEDSRKAMDDARNNVKPEPVPSQPTIMPMPKFCTNCGAPANGAKFCTHCGTKLI
jgi:membrane protease subunit (stomatin/prohibitin family)